MNEEILKEWQVRLGLTDWRIWLQDRLNADEMELADRTGTCTILEESKIAVIQLLKPEEYGERLLPYDAEKTIVHELLHIKFTLLDGISDLHDRILHQLIEEFARAFVEAKRSKAKEDADAGEWEEVDCDVMGEKTLQCSKCSKRTRSFTEPNFCPNCGADMNKEVEQ